MRETITVTIDDIREANMQKDTRDYLPSCGCPIAQAVRRTHPTWTVGLTAIDVCSNDDAAKVLGTISLPLAAQEFVERFDDGLPVEPFEFTIEIN